MSGETPHRHYSPLTAFAIVVASMVGTGVLTSLGFQVAVLQQGFSILFLWILGGIACFCGAMAYAELGTRFPGSGGEYRYLAKMFHPALGFASGWASALVGFAAPIAASGLAMGSYLTHAMRWPEYFSGMPVSTPVLFAWIGATIITLVHALSHRVSGGFQNLFTIFKIGVMLVLIGFGFFAAPSSVSFIPNPTAFTEIVSPGFVISLYFVSYAYSGWNASAYIAGEISNPSKNLPRSLMMGTLVVVGIYVLINAAFLWAVPMEELNGQVDVGLIFSRKIWGQQAGDILGLVIALLLVSGMSSMIIAGSRVMQVMASEYKALRRFGHLNTFGIPIPALLLQWVIISFYIFTASFQEVILYVGFTLNLFAFLSVAGMVYARYKHGTAGIAYLAPAFPWIPGIFLAFSLWLMVYGLIYQPWESISGLGISAIGVFIWFFIRDSNTTPKKVNEDLHE